MTRRLFFALALASTLAALVADAPALRAQAPAEGKALSHADIGEMLKQLGYEVEETKSEAASAWTISLEQKDGERRSRHPPPCPADLLHRTLLVVRWTSGRRRLEHHGCPTGARRSARRAGHCPMAVYTPLPAICKIAVPYAAARALMGGAQNTARTNVPAFRRVR